MSAFALCRLLKFIILHTCGSLNAVLTIDIYWCCSSCSNWKGCVFNVCDVLDHGKKEKSINLQYLNYFGLNLINRWSRLFFHLEAQLKFFKNSVVYCFFWQKFFRLRLITCSWHQKTNSPILHFTNLKCCIKAKEPFKTPF